MCSTCDFASTAFKWTTGISYLDGWEHIGRRVHYECTDPNGCESFNDATKVTTCEVSGRINLLCDKTPIRSDRCTSSNFPYSFIGDVSYVEGNGFICSVSGAKEKLLEALPKTFIRPDGKEVPVTHLGFNGLTTFTRINPECSTGETRCVGRELQNCVGLLWEDGQEVEGKCGVETEGPQTTPPIIPPVAPVACIQNTDCISSCEDNIPTCENNECSCETQSETQPSESVSVIGWIIAGIIVLLIIIIIIGVVRRN